MDVLGGRYPFGSDPRDEISLDVLGVPATMATDGGVEVVQFSFQACDWALAGYGVAPEDMQELVESFVYSTREQRIACREKGVWFRASSPPVGWSGYVRASEGSLGVFATASEPGGVEVHLSEDAPTGIFDPERVPIMGTEGMMGGWDEGMVVMFSVEGCRYSLVTASDINPEHLRSFARSLASER